MSVNRELAEIFAEIAASLELTGANPFRVNAHRRASRVLRDLSEDVAEIARGGREAAVARLTAFDGIGQGMAKKVLEYLETGRIEEHRKLSLQVPAGLLEVLRIPGVGPKAAKAMWEELGISSVEDLKSHLDSPELAALPRMGRKSIENIRKAIEFRETAGERISIGLALPIAVGLVAELGRVAGVARLDYAGSLRRGRETIGDLDLLAAAADPAALHRRFCSLPQVTQVLARGATKSSVRLAAGSVILQADLRTVPAESYGAALLYFTGSKEHNVRLREIAIRQGKRLNEYGLYAGTEERPQESGREPLAAAHEREIYAELGLPYVEPELREDRGELERAPLELLDVADVGAELHAHTTASDGRLTIEELALLVRERGYHTLAITDHSQSSTIARGLDPERLRRHAEAVREVDARLDGLRILAGAEVDILGDGRLDYDDETLAGLDIVIASPHAPLRQEPRVATERLLRAVRHPLVHVLGHPTGRLVNRREGLQPDMNALFAAAAEHDTALEVNANPRRLDLRDVHVRGALEHGCRIAVNTDAHRPRDLDNLVYGVLTARRGGLEARSCINAWPADELWAWLRAKRERAGA